MFVFNSVPFSRVNDPSLDICGQVASETWSLLVPQVTYALLALTRAYGMKAVEWAKDCISLVPLTAVTEVERTSFLQTLSNVATGADINTLTVSMEELSDVCRRNRTVQEIVQGALRPHELNLAPVS